MSGLEFNKIIASIIIAIILFAIIGFLGNAIISISESPKETAYKIEIPEIESNQNITSTPTDSILESISPLLINASLEKGEKIYKKKCSTCHNIEKDSKLKIGPNLWDILNRRIANVDGYAYSKALADKDGSWNYEELNAFLNNPKKYIEGTKMNFAGLKDIQDRADLILWLRENSDNPVSLP
tara:strand:+ start:734 stop:1282 length:549 start_codon:yes stop_codon:yes gene_type:complete